MTTKADDPWGGFGQSAVAEDAPSPQKVTTEKPKATKKASPVLTAPTIESTSTDWGGFGDGGARQPSPADDPWNAILGETMASLGMNPDDPFGPPPSGSPEDRPLSNQIATGDFGFLDAGGEVAKSFVRAGVNTAAGAIDAVPAFLTQAGSGFGESIRAIQNPAEAIPNIFKAAKKEYGESKAEIITMTALASMGVIEASDVLDRLQESGERILEANGKRAMDIALGKLPEDVPDTPENRYAYRLANAADRSVLPVMNALGVPFEFIADNIRKLNQTGLLENQWNLEDKSWTEKGADPKWWLTSVPEAISSAAFNLVPGLGAAKLKMLQGASRVDAVAFGAMVSGTIEGAVVTGSNFNEQQEELRARGVPEELIPAIVRGGPLKVGIAKALTERAAFPLFAFGVGSVRSGFPGMGLRLLGANAAQITDEEVELLMSEMSKYSIGLQPDLSFDKVMETGLLTMFPTTVLSAKGAPVKPLVAGVAADIHNFDYPTVEKILAKEGKLTREDIKAYGLWEHEVLRDAPGRNQLQKMLKRNKAMLDSMGMVRDPETGEWTRPTTDEEIAKRAELADKVEAELAAREKAAAVKPEPVATETAPQPAKPQKARKKLPEKKDAVPRKTVEDAVRPEDAPKDDAKPPKTKPDAVVDPKTGETIELGTIQDKPFADPKKSLKPYQQVAPAQEANVDEAAAPHLKFKNRFGARLMALADAVGAPVLTAVKKESHGRVVLPEGGLHRRLQNLALARNRKGLPTFQVELNDPRLVRTLSHEIGHVLDHVLTGAKKFTSDNIATRFKKMGVGKGEAIAQLQALSHHVRPLTEKGTPDWGKKDAHTRYRKTLPELMADAWSAYLIDRDAARDIAPDVIRLLETQVATNPEVAKAVNLFNEENILDTTKAKRDPFTDAEFLPREEVADKDLAIKDPEARAMAYTIGIETTRKMNAQIAKVHKFTKRLRDATTRLYGDQAVKVREDLTAAVEKTGNPRIKNDTYEKLQARYKGDKNFGVMVENIRRENEVIRAETNRWARGFSENEFLEFVNNYVAHFWKGGRDKIKAFNKSRWNGESSHQKKRTIPTYMEGAELGLEPVTMDVAELMDRAAGANFRVLAANAYVHQILNAQTAAGLPFIVAVKPNKSEGLRSTAETESATPGFDPDVHMGYEEMESSTFSRAFSRVDKDGNITPGTNRVLIHPSIVRPMKSMIADPYSDTLRKLNNISATMKLMNVSASYFHAGSLVESTLATNFRLRNFVDPRHFNPLKGLVVGPRELRARGIAGAEGLWGEGPVAKKAHQLGLDKWFAPAHMVGLHLAFQDGADPYGIAYMVERGLGVNAQASADEQRLLSERLIGSMADTMLDSGRITSRGVGKALKGIRFADMALNRQLWDRMHRGWKIYTASNLMQQYITGGLDSDGQVLTVNQKYIPDNLEMDDVAENIMSFVNDAFGGQERLLAPSFHGTFTKKNGEVVHTIPGKAMAAAKRAAMLGWGKHWEPMTNNQEIALRIGGLFAPDWTQTMIRVFGRTVGTNIVAMANRAGNIATQSEKFVDTKNPIYARLGRNYALGMAIHATIFHTMLQGIVYALMKAGLLDDDEDMKQYPWESHEGFNMPTADVTPLMRTWQRVMGQPVQRHRSEVQGNKQVIEVLRNFTGGGTGLMDNIGNKAAPLRRLAAAVHEEWTDVKRDIDVGQETLAGGVSRVIGQGLLAPFTPFAINKWTHTGAGGEKREVGSSFLFSVPLKHGNTRSGFIREYQRTATIFADPGFFGEILGKGDEAAVRQRFIEIDEDARKNGHTHKERKELFNSGMAKARSFYYGQFKSAIEKANKDLSSKSGGEPRAMADIEQSMTALVNLVGYNEVESRLASSLAGSGVDADARRAAVREANTLKKEMLRGARPFALSWERVIPIEQRRRKRQVVRDDD